MKTTTLRLRRLRCTREQCRAGREEKADLLEFHGTLPVAWVDEDPFTGVRALTLYYMDDRAAATA